MFEKGRGIEKDLNEAIKWYKISALNGEPRA